MPKKTYSVQLRDEEYLQLRQYVRKGNQSARAMNRARILLLADEQRADEEIAETLGIGTVTVHWVRKNSTAGGLTQALIVGVQIDQTWQEP